jgi:hypothetical protein
MALTKQFHSEATFVESFVDRLEAGRTAFGKLQLVTEWNYKAGAVDVLARDATRTLVAFEAKLANWRRAFFQAYRSTSYAERVFVLLPEVVAHRALADLDEFVFRGVGLCSFNGRSLRVLIDSSVHAPLLPWVNKRAHEHFDEIYATKPFRFRSRSGSVMCQPSV